MFSDDEYNLLGTLAYQYRPDLYASRHEAVRDLYFQHAASEAIKNPQKRHFFDRLNIKEVNPLCYLPVQVIEAAIHLQEASRDNPTWEHSTAKEALSTIILNHCKQLEGYGATWYERPKPDINLTQITPNSLIDRDLPPL